MGYRIHDRDFIARLFSRGHKNGFRLITQLLFRFERALPERSMKGNVSSQSE